MRDLLERYRAAERMLPHYTREMVLNGNPQIRWVDGDTFTYMRQVREDGKIREIPRCV